MKLLVIVLVVPQKITEKERTAKGEVNPLSIYIVEWLTATRRLH